MAALIAASRVRARRRAASITAAAAAAVLAALVGASVSRAADDDPARHVAFVQEPTAGCVARNAVQVQVKNTHPTRTLRVWLDRKLMGNGTGDRSRSELNPGAAPEPLGCSRSDGAEQSWVLVRAAFID